jgi:hypothetical protein
MIRKNSEKFEKVVLRKDKEDHCLIDDLEDLQDKSSENIQKVLRERLAIGEDFTFAGKNLIHVDSGSNKINLLKRFTGKVFQEMKKNKVNQVVSFAGSSLRAKEINKNTILTEIALMSNSKLEFVEAVQSAVELVNIFGSDGENICYAECLDIGFDYRFYICDCRVNAKIVDFEMERNSGIFRILMSLSDPTRQHLGLINWPVDNKNIELHQKFKSNLEILGISWFEILDLMELLSVSLLCDSLTFETSSFTLAGQKPSNTFTPVLCKSFQKICKLLGLVPGRFSEFLTSSNKYQGLEMLKSLKKLLLFLAFEGLLTKINSGLKKKASELRLGKKSFTLKLLTSPLAKTKAIIEGFLSNLMTECFEFVSYEEYLSLLTTIYEEKMPASKISVPRCRYILELFLDKSFGLLANFSNENFWKKLFKEIAEDSVYNKILGIEDETLTINFSWGSNSYHLPSLLTQFQQFPGKSVTDLLKKCSHRLVLASVDSFFNFDYKNYLNFLISELLEDASGLNMHVLFNFKDVKDVVFESSVVSMVSLPCRVLISRKVLNSELLKRNGLKFQMTENFYFLGKDSQDLISKVINAKIPNFNCSGIQVVSDSRLNGPKIPEYVDPVVKPMKKPPRSSSSKLRVFSVQSSKTSSKFLNSSLKNFKNYSFTDSIQEVTKIQAFWRGFKARRYFRSLKRLTQAAVKIQKVWKGFQSRKKFNFFHFLTCIKFIQRLYKKWHYRKTQAAKKIQYFFIKKRYRLSFYSRRNSKQLTNSGNFTFKTAQRSIERSKKFDKLKNQFKFKPALGKKSNELANSMKIKNNSQMKVEDRLLLKGRELSEKKDLAIINKKRAELPLRPSGSVKTFNKRFYEDNLRFMNDKKRSLKDLRVLKNQKELANCTFRPVTNNKNRSRSAMETVDELYRWKMKKDKRLENERKEIENEASSKLSNFKACSKSSLIVKGKKQEEQNKQVFLQELQKSVTPYWPNK